ncbi:MAG TPA: VOC family protein [Steroidobacteraceae bacterium]|jgi:PhnB protein
MNFSPYLSFKGNCREAFAFYTKTFNGKLIMQMTYGEAPTGQEMPGATRDQIMHARIEINGQHLMGSDAPGEHYKPSQGIQVAVGVAEPAEAERIFKALSEGGSTYMPMQETFWALRFGMCSDRFGVPWIVNCEKPR